MSIEPEESSAVSNEELKNLLESTGMDSKEISNIVDSFNGISELDENNPQMEALTFIEKVTMETDESVASEMLDKLSPAAAAVVNEMLNGNMPDWMRKKAPRVLNWKETQSEESRNDALAKAEEKRQRKLAKKLKE